MHPPRSLDGTVALADWGVIRAVGADAATFLQGQLTNDVLTLDRAHARLAGFCSAKGRLQATFIVVRCDAETFLLACAADLLASTLKRLSMFVLRAQCKLTDASAEWPLFGTVGSQAVALASGDEPGRARVTEDGIVVRLPDAAGHTRILRFGGAPPTLPTGALALEDWRDLDVQSGVVTIVAATVDRFVPQMVNFETVGGVDFQKGCYPGQEVVARSQYRGTVKRRTVLFGCVRTPNAGDDVFHSSDVEQPSGTVAYASASAVGDAGNGGGGHALAEVKLALLDHGSWHLGAANGPLLTREPLPYALPQAEAESAA